MGLRVECRALASALLLAQGFGDLPPVDFGEGVAHDPRAVARLTGVLLLVLVEIGGQVGRGHGSLTCER